MDNIKEQDTWIEESLDFSPDLAAEEAEENEEVMAADGNEPEIEKLSRTRKPLPLKVKKYLQKMSVKMVISAILFVTVFSVLKSQNDWKEKIEPAIHYILNEQVDFAELKEETESMMEMFYEKLFSKEAG